MKDASEIIHYNQPGLPLYVRPGRLSELTGRKALCHWHEDVEYVKAVKGHMTYDVNGEWLKLKEQDAIFVNSRHMHYGFSQDGTECEYFCVVFSPLLLCSSEHIRNRFIRPVTENTDVAYYHLKADRPADEKVLDLMDRIFELYRLETDDLELKAMSLLFGLWNESFHVIHSLSSDTLRPAYPDLDIQKKMVAFIYENYASRLTLNDIAQAGGVCRSKCCQIFRKYQNRTPVEFLNARRLEVSMKLLSDSSSSITQIALSCGFGNPSYYSELFMKYKGCTPGSFRAQQSE